MNSEFVIYVRGLRKGVWPDVHALSAISTVFFKGERVNRPQVFKQK